MTKSISEDLRFRVIAAVEGGLSRRAAAARFGVAAASAVRWVREWRESGSTRAKPQGGDMRSRRIEVHRAVILGAIEEQVDITLVELAEMLRSEHGVIFAPSTIWRFLDRHAMTVKKKQRTPASSSGPTFSRGDAHGSRPSLISIPNGWCLSMRPARQRRWRVCGDGPGAACGAGRQSRTAIENHHLHRRAALDGHDCAHGPGRSDDWRMVRRLCRAGSGANAAPRRHRHPG